MVCKKEQFQKPGRLSQQKHSTMQTADFRKNIVDGEKGACNEQLQTSSNNAQDYKDISWVDTEASPLENYRSTSTYEQ